MNEEVQVGFLDEIEKIAEGMSDKAKDRLLLALLPLATAAGAAVGGRAISRAIAKATSKGRVNSALAQLEASPFLKKLDKQMSLTGAPTDKASLRQQMTWMDDVNVARAELGGAAFGGLAGGVGGMGLAGNIIGQRGRKRNKKLKKTGAPRWTKLLRKGKVPGEGAKIVSVDLGEETADEALKTKKRLKKTGEARLIERLEKIAAITRTIKSEKLFDAGFKRLRSLLPKSSRRTLNKRREKAMDASFDHTIETRSGGPADAFLYKTKTYKLPLIPPEGHGLAKEVVSRFSKAFPKGSKMTMAQMRQKLKAFQKNIEGMAPS